MKVLTGTIVASVLLAAATTHAESRRLTVDETVQAAIEASPQVAQARANVAAAEDQALSVRGRMLPGVHLSDQQNHYFTDATVKFALPGLPGPAPEIALHADNTNTLAISAGEPLLGLFGLSERYAAANEGAAAAEKGLQALKAGITEQVKTSLYRLFEARATKQIAESSVQQLSDQLAVAKSRLAAGVLTNADVLRIDTAMANARQQVLQAEVASDVARQGLLTALGEPLDADVDFVEPADLTVPPPPDLESAEKRAEAKRPELAAAMGQARAARHQSQAQLWTLAPDINLDVAYAHLEGQVLAPKDEAYLGLQLSWTPFAWGADWYAAQAAGEQAASAEAQVVAQHRQVGLEVASRISQVSAARSAIQVAQTAIASAQEAYRVTEALVKAGSATTTDELSAQAALAQAELNLVRAKYEAAIVQVSLARAVGD